MGQTSAQNRVGPISARKGVGPRNSSLDCARLGLAQKYNKVGPETRPSTRKPNGEGNYFPFPYLLHAEHFCMQEENECNGKQKNTGGEEYLARRRRCCWSNVHVDGAAAEVGGSKRRFPTVQRPSLGPCSVFVFLSSPTASFLFPLLPVFF